MRIGLAGIDSSHAEDFLRHFNVEARHPLLRITAIWGSDAERLSQLLAASPGLAAAASLEQLIAEVDAVIVGDRHGSLHAAHALPCLAAGRPVFVDKPLANSLADATAIVSAAEQAGTPVLSGSALRWQAETLRLKARLGGLDMPYDVTAYGTWYPNNDYGGAIVYAIHTVELMQELLGPAWRKLARKSGGDPAVRYRAGDVSVTLKFRPPDASGASAFGVDVDAKGLRFSQPIPLGDDYMAPVAAQVAQMLATGKSPMTREELLAPVALMAEIDTLLRTED